MKKLVLFFAAALMAVSASAQTVEGSKTFDNIYIGINGGVATKMTHNRWLSNLNPNAGVRIGRYFTPVFGLAVEAQAFTNDRANIKFEGYKWNYGLGQNLNTFVKWMNTSLLATVNLSNWFGGYKGQPRLFEVVALYGLGWGHSFGHFTYDNQKIPIGRYAVDNAVERIGYDEEDYLAHKTWDALTSKAGIDFTFNLGEKKAWQIYVEPAVIWNLHSNADNYNISYMFGEPTRSVCYNINRTQFQLNVGVNYKFKNSNGTHNFKLAELRDQAEIDALNAQIGSLRDELARKPKEVIKEVIKEVPAPVQEVKEVKVEDLVFVTFAQGKSALTKEAKAALDGVKEGVHVQIVGTASPEGSKELNQRLSQARADVVAEYLKGRGVVVDEATGKGVQGVTSNRLAVVYVK